VGVLRYTKASSTNLKWTTLASPLANISLGGWTFATVWRPVWVDTTRNAYDALGYLLSGSGAGSTVAGCSIAPTEGYMIDVAGNAGATSTPAATASAVYMSVITAAGGGGATTAYHYVKSTNTWTTLNIGNQANQLAATMLQIGSWQGSDFLDAWVGVSAFWSGSMSQANANALSTNWRTSDLWQSAHGTPVFLAEQNVAGASVVDLAGNASALTATGVTLDAAETLTSWNFNGAGTPAPKQVKRARMSNVAVQRAATWMKRSREGLLLPDLWTPGRAV
jgi:hypothetical protein